MNGGIIDSWLLHCCPRPLLTLQTGAPPVLIRRRNANVAVQGPDLVLAAAGELAARNVQVSVRTTSQLSSATDQRLDRCASACCQSQMYPWVAVPCPFPYYALHSSRALSASDFR